MLRTAKTKSTSLLWPAEWNMPALLSLSILTFYCAFNANSYYELRLFWRIFLPPKLRSILTNFKTAFSHLATSNQPLNHRGIRGNHSTAVRMYSPFLLRSSVRSVSTKQCKQCKQYKQYMWRCYHQNWHFCFRKSVLYDFSSCRDFVWTMHKAKEDWESSS